jgi:hypothetical protein
MINDSVLGPDREANLRVRINDLMQALTYAYYHWEEDLLRVERGDFSPEDIADSRNYIQVMREAWAKKEKV